MQSKQHKYTHTSTLAHHLTTLGIDIRFLPLLAPDLLLLPSLIQVDASFIQLHPHSAPFSCLSIRFQSKYITEPVKHTQCWLKQK